jgi:hypothetical protein
MVYASLPRYRYSVDAQDVISSVSPNWLAFARENGAPELTAQAVVGHCLWDFIDGIETIRLYQAILQRVRTTAVQILVPFRCDSPTLRRYMRLEISSQPQDSVQLDGLLVRVEPTTARVNLLDPRFPRSHDVLNVCSCCKRAMVEPMGWLEIEDIAVRLHLLEQERAPQMHYDVCPDCRSVCLAVADESKG